MSTPGDAEIVISAYAPDDDAAAVALERRCPQGDRLRLSFRRTSFRLRSESFPDWQIWTARVGGKLVGITASAIKPALLFGRPIRTGFAYDLRVDPAFRGTGLARRLMAVAHAWAFERAEAGYTYSVEGNAVAEHLISSFGATRAGGYEYLIVPALARRRGPELRSIPFSEAHERHLAAEAPLDLYTPPDFERMQAGYVRSVAIEGDGGEASCSVWDNRSILGETVDALPLGLRAVRRLLDLPGLRGLAVPRLPRTGDAVPSWYLFDVAAATPASARDLARAVARQALDANVDWLYWIAPNRPAWAAAVLSEAPRLLRLRLPYLRMLQMREEPTPVIRRAYVDVRDT